MKSINLKTMANKPTEKQMDILNYMSKIIDYWKGTNDIDSPTLQGDLDEELINLEFDLSDTEEAELTDGMNNMLSFIRDRK